MHARRRRVFASWLSPSGWNYVKVPKDTFLESLTSRNSSEDEKKNNHLQQLTSLAHNYTASCSLHWTFTRHAQDSQTIRPSGFTSSGQIDSAAVKVKQLTKRNLLLTMASDNKELNLISKHSIGRRHGRPSVSFIYLWFHWFSRRSKEKTFTQAIIKQFKWAK